MNPSPTSQRHIYVAGPMQGIPNFNFPLFNAVTAYYRERLGHIVFNPAAKDIERHGGTDISADNTSGSIDHAKAKHGFSLRQALAEDCRFICEKCNMIVMLPGWELSKGATAEHRLAVALLSEGMEIKYLTAEECRIMEIMHAQGA